jgi:type II secretory pathway pseudopilin PulG
MLTFLRKAHRRARFATSASEPAHPAAGGQEGFLLIEVMLSALMLGLIAVATVTGLQAVDDSTANQRFHNEAVLLAAQSQEQLRSDPISALEKLMTSPHTYTVTVENNKYTITQEVHTIAGKGETTTCTVVEHSAYIAPNFRVTSTVSWHVLKGGHPITDTSVITPPTSSSLEVDIGNAPSPTAGVSGVSVIATYDAFETSTPIKVEGTTDFKGCVLFTGIRATTATVEIVPRSTFVTPGGALAVPSQEVSIAPNLTTRDQVTYDQGGAIAAAFAYKGKTEFEGKKVTGDTFVVSNTEMGVAPELQIGTAAGFTYEGSGEEHYTAKTSSYATGGVTAKGGQYERGDLFPFPSSWTVYAGDCINNNPYTVTKGAISPGEGVVTPGSTSGIAAPMSYVNLEALQGTEKSPAKTLYSTLLAAKITNLSCSTAKPALATPNNAAAVSYTHTQHLTAGALENPFQPFGKFEVCVQVVESVPEPSKDRIDKFIYENAAEEGAHFKLYPEELTLAGEEKAREELEAKSEEHLKRVTEENNFTKLREAEETTKINKEKEEATTKKNREKEEKTTKENRETNEAALKTKYSNELKSKTITEAQFKTKETELTTKRKEAEKTESTTKTNHENEEATTKKNREKEEATARAKREKEEAEGPQKTKKHEEEVAKAETKKEEENAKAKEKLATEGKAQKIESSTGLKC